MDGSYVLMEGSLFFRFLLLQWMVALSLLKVVCCWDFGTLIEGSLVNTEASSLLRFYYANGW